MSGGPTLTCQAAWPIRRRGCLASAWADPRIGAYVTTHYAVCLEPDTLGRLPGAARALILANGTGLNGSWSGDSPGCYGVTTQVAREIAAMFDDAGIQLDELYSGLTSSSLRVGFVPITPDGEPICLDCG
jgi:hypothetical protein